MDRGNKPSPAWRERVPNAVRRVRVGAPARVASGASGAPTLTRFASLTTLSRQAGEGYLKTLRQASRVGPTWIPGTSPGMTE
jgi:hypothetical protein